MYLFKKLFQTNLNKSLFEEKENLKSLPTVIAHGITNWKKKKKQNILNQLSLKVSNNSILKIHVLFF